MKTGAMNAAVISLRAAVIIPWAGESKSSSYVYHSRPTEEPSLGFESMIISLCKTKLKLTMCVQEIACAPR
jgi:hypothetical protein